MSTSSLRSHYSSQSLLWLASHWPSMVAWTSDLGSTALGGAPRGVPTGLQYPNSFEKGLSVYRATAGTRPYAPAHTSPVIKKGNLCAIVDAHVSTFTPKTLQDAWDQHERSIQSGKVYAVPVSVAQVHEMTLRSLTYAVNWTQTLDMLLKTLPAIATKILRSGPPLLLSNGVQGTSDISCYVSAASPKHTALAVFALHVSYLDFPLHVSPAPITTPTDLGTISILLPSAPLLANCDWNSIQQLLSGIQQEMQQLGVDVILPL